MIVFDTTILVYAVGVEHPLREPCQAAIALVRDGDVRATTTVEVIQEFAHVRARRRSRTDAAQHARNYSIGLAPLLAPDIDDLSEGLELFGRSTKLGAFDTVLASAVRRRGWALASADRSFRSVKDLAFLDPASATFLDDLASVSGR